METMPMMNVVRSGRAYLSDEEEVRRYGGVPDAPGRDDTQAVRRGASGPSTASDVDHGAGVYFCDDLHAIPLLGYGSITAEQRAKLRELHMLDTRYNLMIVFYFAVWCVAGFLMITSDLLLVEVLAGLAIGFCISGLPVLMHESSHQLLSKNKRINTALGFICGLPGLVSVSAYVSMHKMHHAATKTEKDPDNLENSASAFVPLWLVYGAVLLIGVPMYIPTVAIMGFKNARPRMRVRIVAEYLLIAGVAVAAAYLIPTPYLVKLWVIPMLFTIVILNIRGLAEHGMTGSDSVFTNTRTVVSNRFVRFMMCNINYHIEHHLFPRIPWYNLPKAHAILQEHYRHAGSSIYPSYTRFLLDYVKVMRGGVRANVRLISARYLEALCG